MAALRNSGVMRAVATWQSRVDVTPLRCPSARSHRPLVTFALAGRVALVCPDCGYIQRQIPERVLHGVGQPPAALATLHGDRQTGVAVVQSGVSAAVERAARVAFAFVMMNYAAVAGLASLLSRRPLWREDSIDDARPRHS